MHSLFFLLNFLLARREGFVFRSFASSSLTSDPPRSLCQPSLAAMPYRECHWHSRHGRLLTSNPSGFYGSSFLCIVYFFIEFDTGAPGRIRTLDPQIRSLMLYPAELPTLGLDFFKVIYVWGLGKLMPNEEINCIFKWQKLEFYS